MAIEDKDKKENRKFKSLLVAQVLLKRTDEDHAIKTSEIIEHLKNYKITAEAHSVQRDIRALNELFERDNDPNLDVEERERLNYYIEYDKSQHGYKVSKQIKIESQIFAAFLLHHPHSKFSNTYTLKTAQKAAGTSLL